MGWSPDSGFILAESHSGIGVVMRPHGTGRRVVADGTPAGWSPDSKWVLYSIYGGRSSGLWIVDTDGKHRHRVVWTFEDGGVSWGQ